MNQSAQERQLVLLESFNNKLEAILANQAALNATTEELAKQNQELKKALDKQKNESSVRKGIR